MHDANDIGVQEALPDRFIRRWAWRTLLGWIFGIFVIFIPFVFIFIVGNAFKFSTPLLGSLALVWVIASVPIFGAAVGYIQWADWLLGYLPRRTWMVASAVSAILGMLSFWVAANLAPPPTSSLDQYGISRLPNTWFIVAFLWALIVGASATLPYWVLFSRKGYRNKNIFTTTIGGVLLAFTLAIIFGGLWKLFIVLPYEFLCFTPIAFGVAIGFGVKNFLKTKVPRTP